MTFLMVFATSPVVTHATLYSLGYSLGYSGVPFAGGAILLISNLNNTGQLTIRVTSLTFASDFWSNGTYRVTSGLPLNITIGANKEVDTPIIIPTTATIGSHQVTATAAWQYNNSTGWYNANPVVVSKTVLVSQTIDSLFSGFVTIVLIGLGISAVTAILLVFLIMRQRKKKKKASPPPAGSPT